MIIFNKIDRSFCSVVVIGLLVLAAAPGTLAQAGSQGGSSEGRSPETVPAGLLGIRGGTFIF